MSSKNIVEQIRHYQKDIERCPDNAERMIRCIQRLYVLPVLVQHLQETGVGRSVNSLRKFNGEVGEAAKALVAKWKAMVAAEESDDDGDSAKQTDSERNPPNAQGSTSSSKPPKDKRNSTSSSKHSDSGKRSSHKRSHSSSARDVKAEKKSNSSSSEAAKKSSSEENSKDRHSHHDSSKHKESKHRSEHNHSRNSSSSDNHRVKSEPRSTVDEKDHSPVPKKRKKLCVKEIRKRHQVQESEDEASSAANSDDDSQSDRSNGGASPGNSDSGSQQEESSVDEDSSSDEANDDGKSESGSESDQKQSSSSCRKSSNNKHQASNSSSRSSSEKHKHNHYKDEKKDIKKSGSSSSKDLQKLIKANEKMVKKENPESPKTPSTTESPKQKSSSSSSKSKDKAAKVKIETNDDGSIDAGSGCSFADALAGLDSAPKKKKKPTKEETIHQKSDQETTKSSSSSSHRSSSEASHSHKHKSSSKRHSSPSSSKDRSSSSSKKNRSPDTSMPELLKKPIKIENLDLDINSTLPEINLNYRPLPHVPEGSRRNSNKSVVNEEEMFNMMMNKNQRTKVFSGGKSSYHQQLPSLYDLCIKLLYDHIDGLEYTGGVPYDLLKPLLDKLNPDQLFVLEHYNPYLIEDTGTLWEFHSKKDFRSQKRQDMESWRDLYIRCMEEREEKLKALTQNISQSIAQSTPVRKAKLAYVDSAIKPPRNIAKKQAKYGTGESSSIRPSLKSNSAEKREILNKAIVGSQNGSTTATTTVPPPPPSSAPRSNWSAPATTAASQKKRKAPLMAKALQLIKGTNRFKR